MFVGVLCNEGTAPLLVDSGLVNTLFVLMGEKKEDDEFVLQIAFSFNKFMMFDETRTALLHNTQVVFYLVDLLQDKNKEAVFYLVDLLQDKNKEYSKVVIYLVVMLQDKNEEEWAVRVRNLKFESANQEWLDAVSGMDQGEGAMYGDEEEVDYGGDGDYTIGGQRVVADFDEFAEDQYYDPAADGAYGQEGEYDEEEIIATINLGKVANHVTVAKPVWHSKAFPLPTRICSAPRNLTNLATPVGKSPDTNAAFQQKKTQITTVQGQGAALQKMGAALQKQFAEFHKKVEHLQEPESGAIKTDSRQDAAEVTEALIRTLEQIEALKSDLHGFAQIMKQEAESTRALITTLEQNMKQHATGVSIEVPVTWYNLVFGAGIYLGYRGKLMIDLVLSTDMKQHFPMLGSWRTVHSIALPSEKKSRSSTVRSRSAGSSVSGKSNFNASTTQPLMPLDASEKLLSLQVALKMADLGHLTAELPVHLKWVNSLEEVLTSNSADGCLDWMLPACCHSHSCVSEMSSPTGTMEMAIV
eukprot:gene9452-32435_t